MPLKQSLTRLQIELADDLQFDNIGHMFTMLCYTWRLRQVGDKPSYFCIKPTIICFRASEGTPHPHPMEHRNNYQICQKSDSAYHVFWLVYGPIRISLVLNLSVIIEWIRWKLVDLHMLLACQCPALLGPIIYCTKSLNSSQGEIFALSLRSWNFIEWFLSLKVDINWSKNYDKRIVGR